MLGLNLVADYVPKAEGPFPKWERDLRHLLSSATLTLTIMDTTPQLEAYTAQPEDVEELA